MSAPDTPTPEPPEREPTAIDLSVTDTFAPRGRLPRPHERARTWARRRRSTHLVLKGAVLVVGLALSGSGIAMLVLPGPGWAVLVLGLVVLATEFAWAEHALAPVRRVATRGLTAVRRTGHSRAVLVALGLVLAPVVVAALVLRP